MGHYDKQREEYIVTYDGEPDAILYNRVIDPLTDIKRELEEIKQRLDALEAADEEKDWRAI